MLGKIADISGHYLTPKKSSKGEKDFQLIPQDFCIYFKQ